jgi:hypothetical protein
MSYGYLQFIKADKKQLPYQIEGGRRCSIFFNSKIITTDNKDYKYDILLENDITIEVKTHFKLNKWGTFYIEFIFNNKPSGIDTTESIYYCLNDTINYWLIETKILKQLIDENNFETSKIDNKETKTIGYKIKKNIIIDLSYKI